MNYPTVAQMLVEFSNQVKYKLEEVFSRLSPFGYESSGEVLANKFKEAAKEVIKDRLQYMDLSAGIKEALPVEPLYVLPSGDVILLSRVISMAAFEDMLVVRSIVFQGYNNIDTRFNVRADSLAHAQEMRDKILKDHVEFTSKQNTK